MRDTIRRPRIVPNFLIAAVVGAFVALLYVGPLPFSLRGTVAILTAGATFGIFLATPVYLFRDLPDAAFYSVAAVAGSRRSRMVAHSTAFDLHSICTANRRGHGASRRCPRGSPCSTGALNRSSARAA